MEWDMEMEVAPYLRKTQVIIWGCRSGSTSEAVVVSKLRAPPLSEFVGIFRSFHAILTRRFALQSTKLAAEWKKNKANRVTRTIREF